jgi:hypothetical protein
MKKSVILDNFCREVAQPNLEEADYATPKPQEKPLNVFDANKEPVPIEEFATKFQAT